MAKFQNLINQMKKRKPVLLLGAGFSYGAINASGENVPMGSLLANALFDKFYSPSSDGYNSIPKEILCNIEKNKYDLRAVCSALRVQNKVDERNAYIKKVFSGCRVEDNAPQNRIINYPWSYIFTLNIDDLVENIYKKAGMPLTIWDYSDSKDNADPSVPILVKLHGSVEHEELGFVFDEDEYRDFTIESSYLLKEFGHQVVQNDLIMIGTEFQEDDLLQIISIYEKSGYVNKQYKRFIICPTISNTTLMLKVNASHTEEWISATTSDFMRELTDSIVVPSGKKQLLRENGVFLLEDINRQTASTYGIYRGEDSTYADFIHDADIIHSEHPDWIKKIQTSGRKCIFSFSGEDYLGKTCCAKRLLVDLFNSGYEAFQVSFINERIIRIFLDYWQTVSDRIKQVIFIEGAAYSYNQIVKLYSQCPAKIEKLVIITEDSIGNHKTKRYILMDIEELNEIEITPKMDKTIAAAVYDKLSTKHRLGHYLDKIPGKSNPFSNNSKRIITSNIMKEQDLIDALYVASEGRSFRDHYVNWLDKKASDSETKLLQQLCILCQLGIKRIPNQLFYQLGRALDRNFSLKKYMEKFSEVLSTDSGYINLRRGRILYEILKPIDTKLIFSVLYQTASYCVPANEFGVSEKNIIYQKALRVRRIRNSKLLTDNDIINLFMQLENSCSHISYFWVQYGIAAQVMSQYEDANNHLLYAKNMRPNSYQVKHALAKNNMEWGLWCIKNGDLNNGEKRFLDGAAELNDLIYSPWYKKSFRYSVHTMVHMWLLYSEAICKELELNIYEEISSLLNEILSGPLDDILILLIKKYIEHCIKYGKDKYYKDLRSVFYRSPVRNADRETYSID